MKQSHDTIPWQTSQEWQALGRVFRTMFDRPGSAEIRGWAREINGLLECISAPMESLCRIACPGCRDVCCQKAVIWYDLKDLVSYYAAFDELPREQVCKTTDNSGTPACIHLTPSGCSLPRPRRPFICTWYVCPALKQAMAGAGTSGIESAILGIKDLRSRISTSSLFKQLSVLLVDIHIGR